MDSVVVEVPFKPKPNALKATELTANLHSGLHFESRLGDLINRDFVEGLFLIHNQRHYSETSFRTVIDALFKSAFTNDVYQAMSVYCSYLCRRLILLLQRGGSYVSSWR